MKNLVSSVSEDNLQSRCVTWYKNTYRPLRQLLYMVHNDGKKTKRQGAIDKGRGLTKGWPDLNLDIPKGRYHGLRIELKKPGEKPRDEQKEIHQLLELFGYKVIVIDNLEDFQNEIINYLSLK